MLLHTFGSVGVGRWRMARRQALLLFGLWGTTSNHICPRAAQQFTATAIIPKIAELLSFVFGGSYKQTLNPKP